MNTYTQEFKSLTEFYQYICNTPFNEAFRWAHHGSVENDYRFSYTNSFDEAVDLMQHGWTDMAQKLTQKLKATATPAPIRKPKQVFGVAGFQPVVPLYLAGVPTNMIDKQLVAIKSKVITITKSIGYATFVSTNTIIEESIKTMQIIKKLEAQGYRCNLNVALGTEEGNTRIVVKVRVKSADEKMNVSKLAFPLVHPSMLRRLMFRYIEVCPHVTKQFVDNYGYPVQFNEMRNEFPKDIVLPAQFETDVDKIHTLGDLKATV